MGSVRFGSVRFGSVQFGSVRFGSVWFGALGLVWSGLVLFDSTWFGLACLGLLRVWFRLIRKKLVVFTRLLQPAVSCRGLPVSFLLSWTM